MSSSVARYLPFAFLLIVLSIVVWGILEIRFKIQAQREKRREMQTEKNAAEHGEERP